MATEEPTYLPTDRSTDPPTYISTYVYLPTLQTSAGANLPLLCLPKDRKSFQARTRCLIAIFVGRGLRNSAERSNPSIQLPAFRVRATDWPASFEPFQMQGACWPQKTTEMRERHLGRSTKAFRGPAQ